MRILSIAETHGSPIQLLEELGEPREKDGWCVTICSLHEHLVSYAGCYTCACGVIVCLLAVYAQLVRWSHGSLTSPGLSAMVWSSGKVWCTLLIALAST